MSPEPPEDAARRQRFGLALVITLGLLAGGASYFGTRSSWTAEERPPSLTPAGLASGVADPAWDFELPEGPHRAEFQTSCLICHSARLPFGQPPFHKEKWTEVVHKMVAVYGAPMTPKEESEVVDYLLAGRPAAP
jgi:hypothetical protein